MDIKNFILRLGLLSVSLFSGNGNAIPMLMGLAPPEDAKGHDVRFVSIVSANGSELESHEMRALAHALLWDFERASIGALLGNYYGPFDFLHGFYPPSGFSAQDMGMEKFITWADFDSHNDKVISGKPVGFDDEDTAIAEFFATLGFDIVDWHTILENPHVPGQHDTAPSLNGPAAAKPGQRKECSQRQREFSRKSELHDNDCFEAGGLAGFNNNVGRSRISAIVNSSNANSNFRNNSGATTGAGSGGAGGGAGVGGGGGTSPGTSAGGGDGDNGSGSGGVPDTGSAPGTGMENGETGGGDSETRPVPEPATSILVLLGLACMYYRRSRRGSADGLLYKA